ncbi:MAG TPA: RNA polymerase sigma-70 factor [Puia sp.]
MPQENAYTEMELLLMVSAGDEKAFRQIYEQYWNRIYTMALLYFKSPVAAQDMVQEVFLKVWVNRSELPAIASFGAWLRIIARNFLISSLRKKTTQYVWGMEDNGTVPDQASSADEQLVMKETAGLIRRAIEQLPPQQQKIYRMSREEGLKLTEVAAALDLSHNTVREHMSKALKNIRLYLIRHLEIGVILFQFFLRQVLKK